MSGALAGGEPGLVGQTGTPFAPVRYTDRGTSIKRTMVSAALFLPLLAWWPMVLWLFTFDPLNETPFPEYYADYLANGPATSLILIWALTALMPVYMVLVLAFWSRSVVRAAVAVPLGAIGALGFWGGQIPVLVRSGEYGILNFCSDHMPVWVVMLIVAWSIARRRQLWWVLAVPVIALLAVNAYEGWAVNPVRRHHRRRGDAVDLRCGDRCARGPGETRAVALYARRAVTARGVGGYVRTAGRSPGRR